MGVITVKCMTAFISNTTTKPTLFCVIPFIKLATKSNFNTITTNSSVNNIIPKIWSSNKYYQRRSISSISSSNNSHYVNQSSSIDSPLINSMQIKIKEELNAESVIVKDAYGDGRHVSIDVISSVFEGQSAVSRQRMVYKAIWEELQNTVHAVDQMTTKTPSEASSK